MQTDILSALEGTDAPREPVTLPEYQTASHGPVEPLFAAPRTIRGQMAIATDASQTLITTNRRTVAALLEAGWVIVGHDYRGWVLAS